MTDLPGVLKTSLILTDFFFQREVSNPAVLAEKVLRKQSSLHAKNRMQKSLVEVLIKARKDSKPELWQLQSFPADPAAIPSSSTPPFPEHSSMALPSPSLLTRGLRSHPNEPQAINYPNPLSRGT